MKYGCFSVLLETSIGAAIAQKLSYMLSDAFAVGCISLLDPQ